ncbi:MAG: 2,3-bisphosphoglycerate-independent phosphoglycerate mutase [Burkholderiales bacterium]|jgi:2,3-bisphosphoglycerate-independent phosphoglycerate mutase|nr:2,3-bisphosphoglycerate-independent phosphoglycerate mutase [Burkholderiales bacterium]
MRTQIAKKALLIILDGFGIRNDKEYNAISAANTPNWDYYTGKYAFGSIDASSFAVGLPKGQFGNSEVGHLNIGAGRVVHQDISRIDFAIEDESFGTIEAFNLAFDSAKSGNLHIMGLLSDGGVHSHINHILALIDLANNAANINQVWVHIFLDGRDTPPQSAIAFLERLLGHTIRFPKVKIATCSGRYYAMDRDKRYERLKLAYDAIIFAKSDTTTSDVIDAVKQSYKNGVNDEFVMPMVMSGYSGVQDGDSVIFANFRSDRAIQLTDAMTNPQFSFFATKKIKFGSFVTMTEYDPKLLVKVAFPKGIVANTLGEYISGLGLKQLHIAETEKYPHVTYFFNGGKKGASPGEDWILVNSPRDVATYDEKPEMSLPEVTEKLITAIESEKYEFIVTNFANGDMVGHSGNFNAAVKAVEALDVALGKIIPVMLKHDGEVLVVADHGNCEIMFDKETGQGHTQHTTNLVPCLYIGRSASIMPNGALKDVAPTILKILGIVQPPEMSGHNLIKFKD